MKLIHKNTIKAIEKRLAAGETSFRIGKNTYFRTDRGLYHHTEGFGGCPFLDGTIENGEFNPGKFFTDDEIKKCHT